MSYYIAEGAVIKGNVTLKDGANVWYNATIRGDSSPIIIGENSNIQDNCVVHVDTTFPTTIGKNVTVGHGAILHGCTIGDNSLIGMGAVVLNGAKIGRNAMVAAGALVTQGTVIPDGYLAMGSPAKVRRPLTEEEIAHNIVNALQYTKEASEEFSAQL